MSAFIRSIYFTCQAKFFYQILVGMDIEPAFQNQIKEFQLLEKIERSRGSVQDDFYRSLVRLCNDTDFFERAAPAAQEGPSGPSPAALIGAPGLPVITPGVPHAPVNNWDSIKSFWRSRNLFSKRFLAAGGIKTKTGIEEQKLENLLSYSLEMEELEEGEDAPVNGEDQSGRNTVGGICRRENILWNKDRVE